MPRRKKQTTTAKAVEKSNFANSVPCCGNCSCWKDLPPTSTQNDIKFCCALPPSIGAYGQASQRQTSRTQWCRAHDWRPEFKGDTGCNHLFVDFEGERVCVKCRDVDAEAHAAAELDRAADAFAKTQGG